MGQICWAIYAPTGAAIRFLLAPIRIVRRQSFWDQERPKLRESLACFELLPN